MKKHLVFILGVSFSCNVMDEAVDRPLPSSTQAFAVQHHTVYHQDPALIQAAAERVFDKGRKLPSFPVPPFRRSRLKFCLT